MKSQPPKGRVVYILQKINQTHTDTHKNTHVIINSQWCEYENEDIPAGLEAVSFLGPPSSGFSFIFLPTIQTPHSFEEVLHTRQSGAFVILPGVCWPTCAHQFWLQQVAKGQGENRSGDSLLGHFIITLHQPTTASLTSTAFT